MYHATAHATMPCTHPYEELLCGASSARLHRGVLEPAAAAAGFARVHAALDWQQHRVRVFGREHLQPRLVALHGDAGTHYRYSGLTLHAQPWADALVPLRTRCEQLAGVRFNSVLANLYRDGADTVGWHSDDEPELGAEQVIASLSLGACRRFELREKASGHIVKVELPPGSVLLMSGRCQADWRHRLPRALRVREPRINLTFRRILLDR